MNEGDLLSCLIHVIGRVAVSADQVRKIVGSGKNRINAFNLCDGKHTLQEISGKTKINSGNLSKAATYWVKHGIAFRIGEGNDMRLLHIYPIPEKERRRGKGKKKR